MTEAARDIGKAGESALLEYYRKNLYSFGMSPYQVEEMERTRTTIPEFIEIRAPIAGFILYRNVSPGLRFDRGIEFFRIADLSRVWIVVDLFETEASYFKPGMRVKMELPYQKKTLYARISNVLPQFDPASRTLKMRLVAENPGYVMRPDMFVNVELPANGPPAIIVPIDAVIDSGLKKTVFVDRENGYFEPRHVETGHSLGEQVEILSGLMPGEKIVVSGNFLIDSEARMQQAATGITGKIGRDPVCGMNIDEDRARAEGNFMEYSGQTYFFCDPKELEAFRKEPERYLKSSPAAQVNISSKTKTKAAVDHTSHGTIENTVPDVVKARTKAHDDMKTVVQVEPGPSSLTDGTAPIHGKKTGDMLPPASGNPAQTLPSFGPGMAMPGMQGTTPLPSQKPGNMLPPAPVNPVRMMPGNGTSMAMPGAPESPSLPRPTSSGVIFPPPNPVSADRPMNATDDGNAHD